MPKEYFRETQKIQKLWFWVIGFDLLIVSIILLVILSKNNVPVEDMFPHIIILVVAFSFVTWIFTASKLLITVIDDEGIHYRYPVFKPKWKKISRDEIKPSR